MWIYNDLYENKYSKLIIYASLIDNYSHINIYHGKAVLL